MLGVAAHAGHRAGHPADGQGLTKASPVRTTPASRATWAGRRAGKWGDARGAAWGGRAASMQRVPGRYPASGTVNTTAKPVANGS